MVVYELRLKDFLWRAASASRVVDFIFEMDELKGCGSKAYEMIEWKASSELGTMTLKYLAKMWFYTKQSLWKFQPCYNFSVGDNDEENSDAKE